MNKRLEAWKQTIRNVLDERRPNYRHQCLKCGFFAFDDGMEATTVARETVACGPDGPYSWWQDEAPLGCAKRLWIWQDDAPINVLIREANRPRFWCRGFYRYQPGRSPKAHFELEDERRKQRHQWRLAILAFLGALIGSVIGAWLR